MEDWVRNELLDLIPEFFQNDENVAQYFGLFKAQPNQFKFQDREKNLIIHLRNHIDFMLDPDNLLKEISGLHLTTSSDKKTSYGSNERCLNDEEFEDIMPEEIPETQTHIILKTFLETANSNALTKRGGYRYSESTKRFATYFRILAGPKAYLAVQKNMEIAMPSLTSVNRYIHKTRSRVTEGILRDTELLLYLQERNLPLVVALAEDSTDIENYIQYDPQNNICVGFVLPINDKTGMPTPFAYKARSAEEIVGHFYGTKTATQVTTIMAKPIAPNVASFCLLVFGTDNTNKTKDVTNRWNFVTQELKRLHIDVLTFSSDSDPKYNSAMRTMASLAVDSNVFGNAEWFNCGNREEPPFFVQDTPHIGTKCRNMFLKTGAKPEKLPFGNDFFIQVGHLNRLTEEIGIGKDKHGLTATILNPKDRQNYDSALKICTTDVIDLMKLNVPNSDGTAFYLQSLRNFIDSYMDTELSPLDRVYKLWYSIFMIRIWRRSIVSNKSLSVQTNFLTNNCYVCLELNAHSMVLILIYLKKHNMQHLFMPWLFNSQSCENFYRLIRSLTTVFARAANCSVKDVLERIHKIQLLADIVNDSGTKFTFLRKKQPIKSETTLLPTKCEIKDIIEKSKVKAIEDAIKIGLLDAKYEKLDLKCNILPLSLAKKPRAKLKKVKYALKNDNSKKISFKLSELLTISLKNYSYKFANKDVDKISSFVEIPGSRHRMIVKKTSLIWLMRQDPCKLSSDRLQRVKTTNTHLVSRGNHARVKKTLHFSKSANYKFKPKRKK